MTTNRPELTDDQFIRLLELTGEHLTVPPMRDVASTALERLSAEQPASQATDNAREPSAGFAHDHVWRPPTAAPSLPLEPSRPRWRELALFAGGLAAALVVGLALLLVFRGLDAGGGADDSVSQAAIDDRAGESIAYVVTHDFNRDADGEGEVVVINEATGEVIKRIDTGSQPSVVVAPNGELIYLLETHWATPRSAEHRLSIIDTETWETVDSIEIQGRVQYRFSGPPDLILSPDGMRLFIMATDGVWNEEESSSSFPLYSYWLDVYDATTLEQLAEPQGIRLPYCGWLVRLATVGSDVGVLCAGVRMSYGERPLYLIDPVALDVRATFPLPEADYRRSEGRPRDLVVSEDGATAYVVTGDLGIIEIDGRTRQIVGTIDAWERDEETVYGVKFGEGGVLLVGEGPDRDKEESDRSRTGYSVTRIDLASMTVLPPIELPEQTMFEAGPGDALYVWIWGDSALERMDPSGNRQTLPLDLRYPPVAVARPPVAVTPPEPASATAREGTKQLRPLMTLNEPGRNIGTLAWSPDSTRLAAAEGILDPGSGSTHSIYVWSADGELLNTPEDSGSTIMDLAWSTDGELLASGDFDGNVHLWSADGELQDTLAVSEGMIEALAWSPTDDVLAVRIRETSREQERFAYYVYLLQPDGEVIARLEGGPSRAGSYNLAWTPDGSLLVSGAVDFHAWTPGGADVISVSPGPPDWRTTVTMAILPDGEHLMVGNVATGIHVYSMRGDHLQEVTERHAWFSVSPDGSTVALVSTAVILLAPVDALDTPEAHIPSGSVTNIVWSPDGEWLATSIAGVVSLWDMTGTRLAELRGCDGRATVLSLSPDGTTLAAGYESGQVCLWDLTDM